MCDQIKKNEMGWACSKNRVDRVVGRIFVGKHEGKKPPEIPSVDGRIILK
jgi:hypothetical protein